MTRSNHKIVTLDGAVSAETAKAYRFSADGENFVWLPKSQCEWDADAGEMQLPEWLAIEKELV